MFYTNSTLKVPADANFFVYLCHGFNVIYKAYISQQHHVVEKAIFFWKKVVTTTKTPAYMYLVVPLKPASGLKSRLFGIFCVPFKIQLFVC